jgi:ferredoxin
VALVNQNAIYEGGVEWRFSDGTSIKGMFVSKSGLTANVDAPQIPVSIDIYYIVSYKCTECVGFHDELQCAAVCPVDCCVDDISWRESKEELMTKKDMLHLVI